MSGAGNDFVVINNMEDWVTADKSKLAIALCSRRFGIGADGLLLMEQSSKADFSMKYYNADGSYGGMCGNGGRCISRFAVLQSVAQAKLTFDALDEIYSAQVNEYSVKLQMISPKVLSEKMLVHISSLDFYGFYADTGSPHFVIEVADVDSLDVDAIGREIRHHRDFAPKGCNVNFIERVGESALRIRTYERGVEAETLACGTGAVAASIVLASVSPNSQSPVTLNVRSGEQLLVHFHRKDKVFSDIILEGSAHMLFSGVVEYDPHTNAIVDHAATRNASLPA